MSEGYLSHSAPLPPFFDADGNRVEALPTPVTPKAICLDSARGHIANGLQLLQAAEYLTDPAEVAEARARATERMRLALEAIDSDDRTMRALRIEISVLERELGQRLAGQ
jgi:hypothetical protein